MTNYTKDTREIIPGLSFDGYLIDSAAPKIDDKTLDFGIKGVFYRENSTESELSSTVTLPLKAETVKEDF
jgi:hypothetical protein